MNTKEIRELCEVINMLEKGTAQKNQVIKKLQSDAGSLMMLSQKTPEPPDVEKAYKALNDKFTIYKTLANQTKPINSNLYQTFNDYYANSPREILARIEITERHNQITNLRGRKMPTLKDVLEPPRTDFGDMLSKLGENLKRSKAQNTNPPEHPSSNKK